MPNSQIQNTINKLRPIIPAKLYHYCAKEDLKYFLGTEGEISCRHATAQEDRYEVWEGCRAFKEFIKSRYGQTHRVYQLLTDELVFSSVLGDIEHHGCSPLKPFTFSFTGQVDAPYQWKHYTGPQGGFSIEFDTIKLIDAIKILARERFTDVLYLFAPCFYREVNEDEIRCLNQALLCEHVEDFNAVSVEIDRNVLAAAVADIRNKVFAVAPLIKQKKYRHEQEWRLVMKYSVSPMKERVSSGISSVIGGLGDIITGIMLSPQGDEEELSRVFDLRSIKKDLRLQKSSLDCSVVENYIEANNISTDYEDYVVAAVAADHSCKVDKL